MNIKKIISAALAGVIAFSTVAMPAFADNSDNVPFTENWEHISYKNSIYTDYTLDIMELLEGKESLNWMIIGASSTAPTANGTNNNWGSMLEHRIKNELGRSYDTFVNIGIAGFSYSSFTSYWEGRVAKYKPDVVVISLGTNGNATKDQIKAFYQKLKEVNPDVIIIPTVSFPQKYTSYEAKDYGDRDTWGKAKTTLEAAHESGLTALHLMQGFLDRRGEIEAIYGNEVVDPTNPKSDPMFETMYFRPQTSIMAHNGMPDDLHPDRQGHPLIGKILLKSLGLWDLESSNVCRYIENAQYTWATRKSPYVKLDKSAIVQKQFAKPYAKFMGAYTDGTKIHNSFPVLALVGGDTISGQSEYTGKRNVAQQIAYVLAYRANSGNTYNNSRVINAGFGGADINTMTRLYKEKIASIGSTLVLFMPEFEVNAMPSDAELANYKACLTDAVNTAKENKSEIGFITPPARGDYRDEYIDAYINVLKQTATELSVNVIDFNKVMKDTGVNYPDIYKDWYDEQGKPNNAMSGVLMSCIMDSIGYVNDSGVAEYFSADIRSQAVYRQNKLNAVKQNVGENGEWIIDFNVSNLCIDQDAEVYGMLNGERVEVSKNGDTVSVTMPNLINEFVLYYASNGRKYLTPPFKQYFEYSYDLEGKTYVSIATGSGRTIRPVSVKENLEPKHEVEGHDYIVTRVAANESDAGYTFARKANYQDYAVELKDYNDNLASSAKQMNICAFDSDGKMIYSKTVANEAQSYAARCEAYELFGIYADIRAIAFN